MNFILFLIIGAIAGWLAGKIMKGRGFGVLGNIVVGIVGSFLDRVRAGPVPLAGLMAIPPADRQAGPYFALLASITTARW